MILARHIGVVASSRGALMNCRHRLIKMPLATNTVPSQISSSRGGAQNMAPMATMMASSGVVTAADSSFRTNIRSSSYSNSGLPPDL